MNLQILQGDALTVLKTLPECSVQCCVTSPPYWGLRDYGVDGQLGLERTPEEYVSKMVAVFLEVRRVLREDGTLWLNIGDSYASGGRGGGMEGDDGEKQRSNTGALLGPKKAPPGLKPKDLVGIPWRLAFALQSDGWWLRQDIVWAKPNPMPESVTDRCTKAHEYIFLMTKSAHYYFDAEAIKEPIKNSSIARLTQDIAGQEGSDRVPGKTNGKMKAVRFGGNKLCPDTRLQSGNEWDPSPEGTVANKRSVWTVPTGSFSEAHFATFPPNLIKPCIMAGTSARGCCPKCGSPWERIVENTPEYQAIVDAERNRKGGRSMRDGLPEAPGITRGTSNKSLSADRITTGWHPTCECGDASTVSCTVLDPFGGSGTTGMVALELGRKALLIELNPNYVKLAQQRCDVTPGLALA